MLNRKNVFIRTMLRQPIRHLLLALLVMFSGFMLVSQVVEHRIIQAEAQRIGNFYRSIGYLERIGHSAVQIVEEDPMLMADVSVGAQLVSESPLIAFEDRRMDYFVHLNDFNNGMIYGVTSEMGSSVHLSDAYFHGELLDREMIFGMDGVRVSLIFKVEEIEVGYGEHLAVGEEILLYGRFPTEMSSIFEEMNIGQRYFIRGTYYHISWHPTYRFRAAIAGWRGVDYYMHIKPFGADEWWFHPSVAGQTLDFDALGLTEEMNQLRENQRGMFLRTTKDMTAHPFVHNHLYWSLQGRFLDLEDQLNENPVVVICGVFARVRDITVGDTLSLTLRNLPEFSTMGILREMTHWENYPTVQLELEVVGIFSQMFMHYQSLQWAYVPESTIPEEFRRDNWTVFDNKYSFVLTSSRDQQEFLDKNREPLYGLGFEVDFVPHNGEMMWDAMHPVLRSGRINIMIFSGLFLLILALVSVLLILMWHRYFAILRALGCSKKHCLMRLIVPVALIWLPFLLIGSFVARHLAISGAYESLSSVFEMAPELGLDSTFSLLQTFGLGSLLGLTAALMFSLAAFGVARQSVLELLQGGRKFVWKKRRRKTVQAGDAPEDDLKLLFDESASYKLKESLNRSLLQGHEVEKNPKYIKEAMRRQVLRSIFRLPVKSILVAGLALCFVIAMGLLREAIVQSEKEIEQLYNTTIVTAQIRNANRRIFNFPFQTVERTTIDMVVDTGFIQNVYLETGKMNVHFVPTEQIEHRPEGRWLWHNPHREEDTRYNTLYSFSDVERFLSDHRGRILDLLAGPGGSLLGISEEALVEIEFGVGFDESDFVFEPSQEVVPVIVGEYLMRANRSLSVGDYAYVISRRSLVAQRVEIIGTARGWAMAEEREFWAEGMVFLPIPALEMMRAGEWWPMSFETAIFEIDPSRNRELQEFREYFQEIEENTRMHYVQKRFILHDEELRGVVEQLEQTLQLLEILYPFLFVISLFVAFGFSVLLNLQNARGAAVMRILGLEQSKTRILLNIGQMVVCAVGLLLGLLVLTFAIGAYSIILNVGLFVVMYFVASWMGAVVGAILVSNKPVLELLQVKE